MSIIQCDGHAGTQVPTLWTLSLFLVMKQGTREGGRETVITCGFGHGDGYGGLGIFPIADLG